MTPSTLAPLRTLNLCVTNLREDEYQFLRQLVALLTDPMLDRQRQELRRGDATLTMSHGGMQISRPLTHPSHIQN